MFDIELIARTIVFETAEAVNVSMQLDKSFAAGASVQAVDILSDERKLRRAFFHFRQSVMRRLVLL